MVDSKPGTAVLVEGCAAFTEKREFLFGDASSCIGNLDLQFLALCCESEGHGAIFLDSFDGVVKEVGDHSFELDGIDVAEDAVACTEVIDDAKAHAARVLEALLGEDGLEKSCDRMAADSARLRLWRRDARNLALLALGKPVGDIPDSINGSAEE